MFRNIFIILTSLLATSCSYRSVNPELQPYMGFFESIYNQNCYNSLVYPERFIVMFDVNSSLIKDQTVVGVCVTLSKNTRFIIIDKTHWNSLDHDYKTSLIFHELTHCLLNKDHVNDMNNYMYFEEPEKITSFDVYRQFIQNVKSYCK